MAFRILAKLEDQTLRAVLGPGRTVIGSDPSCDFCLPNCTVSRRHAAVFHAGSSLTLEDLGSRNGTLLRSRRIERAELQPGDVFVVGRAVMLLEEVADDDLEIGVRLPGTFEAAEAPEIVRFGEATESFSPLDRFSLDALPRLLGKLLRGTDREHLAQSLGCTLNDVLPALAVEVSVVRGEGRGVLYSVEAGEREVEGAVWIEALAGACQVRALFDREPTGRHYRPVLDSSALLLALVDARRTAAGEREGPTTVPFPTPPERPAPASAVPEIERIYDQSERVARGDVGVLIYGESGTGKEVLARFIHGASPRAAQPLVAINCASLPRDLLEAELFGVEKGVATGVEARPGKFEAADRGTIFLDEIGDMAPETQAKILRVLQEKEVFRIGGSQPQPARARVIAATNRPIAKMLADGTFRRDLYHRIATWEVELPPLRQRRADIPNLAAHFLAEEAQRLGIRARGISRAALAALGSYRWPGNIRQLRNEIARAVLFLEDGELLDTALLGPAVRGGAQPIGAQSLAAALEAVEREEIAAALEASGGDTAAAAARLEISRPTLYRRLKILGLEVGRAAS